MRDPRIHLESFAPTLLEFKGSQMEFVGQYESLSEPSPDSHFKLDRVLPRAQYVVRHGNCCFRLLFRGSDGRSRPYLVMNVRAMTTDDRWLQYRHIVNNALLKSCQARARYLTVHGVTSVLVTSRLRITADLERHVNLGQVLRKSLSHTSPPAIALRHIEELISSGSVTSAFQSVSQVVPPTLLRDHVAKAMGSVSQLWMLRRAFSSHYGLSLIFGYSLCTTPLHADRLTFSLDTGHIFYQEVRPSFDSKFCLKSKYPIPFRFTPNIVLFLQPVRDSLCPPRSCLSFNADSMAFRS
jgi:transformation/transcription domain-associated protein